MASEVDSFGTPLCSHQILVGEMLICRRDQITTSNFAMIDKYVSFCQFTTRILYTKTVKSRKGCPESKTGEICAVRCYRRFIRHLYWCQ